MAKKTAIKIEAERSNFKILLAKNPNHFGNLTKSGLKAAVEMKSNTKYEELTCVGFNPAKDLLEATVALKLSNGYSGGLCSSGSIEYVRFFVDYGSGWEDLGYSGINVHDIPTGKDCAGAQDKPLMYVASLKFKPKRDCCDTPILPAVRAYLSWQTIPPANAPAINWQPPWGNILECNIQVQPYPWNTLFCLVKHIGIRVQQKIPIPPQFEQAKFTPICLPDPPPPPLSEIAQMYVQKAKKAEATEKAWLVETHRFGLKELHAAIEMGGFSQDALVAKIDEWKMMNIDWTAAVAALEKTKADVSYEEIECLGIDNIVPERLAATFRIKRPVGYNGNLCSHGSTEYVAFWADWDNTCQWTYLGTAQVSVHDIPQVSAKKTLCYTALLPVDLTYLRRSCEKPKIARIRAVLSWNVPPSTTDPEALTYWGNRRDAHIQINPGDVIDPDNPTAQIRNIGGIAIEDIDTVSSGMTTSTAVFAHYPYIKADQWNKGRHCPFGSTIIIEGNYYLGYYYRVRVRKKSDPINTLVTLGSPFDVERADVGYDHQVSTIDGWFTYLDPLQEFTRILALWYSSGDDLWEVQLDIAVAPNESSIIASSPWYRIQLDNTAPTIDIHISSGGDCKDVEEGSKVTGNFIADDLHFGGWSLSTLPNNATTQSNDPTPSPFLASTDPAPVPSGNGWVLDTATPVKMKPCGYVVRLEASDRTISGSYPSSHNWNHIEVGFCLREKAQA